jgi:tetratricopeptide (TPR) repeat protein
MAWPLAGTGRNVRSRLAEDPVKNFKICILLSLVLWFPHLTQAAQPNAFAPSLEYSSTASSGLIDSRQDANNSLSSLLSSFEKALAEGQTERARAVLTQLLQYSLSADMLLKLGVELAQRELYAEATEVFTRCLKESPKLFEAHYNLALAYLALQKYPEALSSLERAPETTKAETTARSYLRGKILEALGRTNEAEEALSAAFSSAPQQENYALDLGLLYLQQRVYPKATAVFSRGGRFNPRSPYLLLGLSLAQFLGGKDSESVETCRRLVSLDASFSPGWLLLGFALYENGDFEEAGRVADKGLGSVHPNPYLYYLRAAALLKLQSNDYERISKDLATSSGAIPGCALCYLAQSKVLEAQGDLQSAIAKLEQAVKLDPNFEDAWYRLSTTYARAGRREEAARAGMEFSRLKSEKTNHDTEILREVFLKTLATQE